MAIVINEQAHSPATTAPEAAHPADDPRFKLVDRTIKRCDYQRDALLEVLNTAQEAFGHLSEDLLTYVSDQLRVPLSRVYGVATFYHMFSLEPLGEHTCIVCLGTACYVEQANEILGVIQNELGIKPGEITSDGTFSLATSRCLGSCGLAPVLVINGEVFGCEMPATTLDLVRALIRDAKVQRARAGGSHLHQEEAGA